jgi:hypothetical protein
LVLEPRGLIYLSSRALAYFRAWPLAQDIGVLPADD